MALFGKKKTKGAKDDVSVMSTEEPIQETVADAAPAAASPKLKVRPDAYTLLLGLSVVALIVACVLLYMNIAEYGASPLSGLKG